MENEFNFMQGVVDDPRIQEEKDKDYPHSEVAMAVPLNWKRGIEGAPVYSQKDQNGGSYCVGEGCSKGLETILGEIISAHPIYARRNNAPGLGMWLQDAGDIIYRKSNGGTTTEAMDPSQKMTDDQISRPVTVPTPINGYLYAFPIVKNIDEIAQAIENRKHCMITIAGTIAEYANSEKPVVIPSDNINCRHCICGVYYFTDENGVKCILADESWGPNYIRRRILTEDYLKARGTGAMYFIPPVPPSPPVKPKYKFTEPLLYGQTGDAIKALQNILKFEGLFPTNIDSTGYYGPITAKWVYKWQVNHNVASMAELNGLGGRRVGYKTIAKLNELYS